MLVNGHNMISPFCIKPTCSLPAIQMYMQLVRIAQCIDRNPPKVQFDQWYVALTEGILPNEVA